MISNMRFGWAAICIAAGFGRASFAQWLPGYQIYSITRIGLTDAVHTGNGGLQFSSVSFFSTPAFVSGTSRRSPINSVADNGRDAWVWNGNVTTQIGLNGGSYTGAAGFQWSDVSSMNSAGQVVGHSRRITGTNTSNGQDAWVWNGTTTVQIGLTGGGYSDSSGFQFSQALLQNDAGQVAGVSNRIAGGQAYDGQDAWVWNGTTTTQIGLTGGVHTGSAGYQASYVNSQNAAGHVTGVSERVSGIDEPNGQDAWVWNGTTTTQIGLTGAVYTGSAGYQYSDANLQNAAGQVVGLSGRVSGVDQSNGSDAWVWNGTTTTQIGLAGGVYTGSAGYQSSYGILQNEAGQVVGNSVRISGVNKFNGRDAWIWNGTNTIQIGLTGGDYTGSAGYQSSEAILQNAAGQVVGSSARVSGIDKSNGYDSWIWNGATTVQVGLTGGAYTGSAGYQASEAKLQNAAGQVVGTSLRISGVEKIDGRDAWVWNGTTTARIGLTGGVYTGASGFQVSDVHLQNAAGQVAGTSIRITGVDGYTGEDTWYFDPTTHFTTAVIGSVRVTDNYALSRPTILTDGGFLLGNYLFFSGGFGLGEQRAFIYRPDLGFTDLGSLVAGGLTASGWLTLRNPLFSDALNSIVGYGMVEGQNSGQSVFVMTIPAPGSMLIVLSSLLCCSRRGRERGR